MYNFWGKGIEDGQNYQLFMQIAMWTGVLFVFWQDDDQPRVTKIGG